jgi:hypothetical protein
MGMRYLECGEQENIFCRILRAIWEDREGLRFGENESGLLGYFGVVLWEIWGISGVKKIEKIDVFFWLFFNFFFLELFLRVFGRKNGIILSLRFLYLKNFCKKK